MAFIVQDGARRDVPRAETRIRCRVRTAPVTMILPGGHLVYSGDNEIVCYASDFEKIKKLLPTERDKQMIELAKEQHEMHLQEHLAQKGMTAENYGGSIQAEFHMLTRGDMPAVLEAEELETMGPEVLGNDAASVLQALQSEVSRERAARIALETKIDALLSGQPVRKEVRKGGPP